MTLKTPFHQFSFKMFYLEAGLPDKEDEMKRVIKDQKWEMGAQSRKGQYNFSRKTRKFVGLIIFEKTIKNFIRSTALGKNTKGGKKQLSISNELFCLK